MDRREWLAFVTRIAAASSWLRAVQAGAFPVEAHDHTTAPPEDIAKWRNYQPEFFTKDQFRALDQFTAILIPTDETPGAREAYVAPFIDFVVAAAHEYAPEMQASWKQTAEWLTSNEITETWMNTVTETGYYQRIKDLAVYAFYTSRAGLIGNLEYKGLAYLTEFPGCNHPEHHHL